MLDLAAQLGQGADQLARTMTEPEFDDWQTYARRKMLPQRRLELYLAQIALLIATVMGNAKNAKLSDFLFDPQGHAADADMTAEEEAAFFDFKPHTKE